MKKIFQSDDYLQELASYADVATMFDVTRITADHFRDLQMLRGHFVSSADFSSVAYVALYHPDDQMRNKSFEYIHDMRDWLRGYMYLHEGQLPPSMTTSSGNLVYFITRDAKQRWREWIEHHPSSSKEDRQAAQKQIYALAHNVQAYEWEVGNCLHVIRSRFLLFV